MIERHDNTMSFCPEGVNFAAIPAPRTQETLYVRLACEPNASRVTLGHDAIEPTDLTLDEAEELGHALLRAVSAGHCLYPPE